MGHFEFFEFAILLKYNNRQMEYKMKDEFSHDDIFYKRGFKMKSKRILLVLFASLVMLLAACQESSEETGSNLDTQSEENSGSEQSPENSDPAAPDEQDESSNEASDEAPAEDPSDSADNSDSEEPESKKEEYLAKLDEIDQEMTEMMENSTASNTVEMKKEASDRWEAWDEALNEIYAVLEEQLSQEEMDALRIEQRSWIEHRDTTAKEASLKYEGGTQENVEYTAVMADVTRERCYELVNEYMQ
ncbi:DUF1311 domain-containing protein [Bacillus mesophilum]|uniref:DUF1311 domain-containing protein n=2 Tax=Bacillus mesophilum TaxID=1071718 RepID=A0A7V7RHJ6_9BACI|nr:DUF1311 domain-containing protein [Bacillus mesophilum]